MKNALKVLGLQQSDANDFGKVRNAYAKKIRQATGCRELRIPINIAYQQLCHKIFNSPEEDPIYYHVLQGQIYQIKKRIEQNKKLINYKSKGGYPLIYIAVRSGHYDIVQLLLKWGCDMNFKDDKSTPMHCAAFYGHITLIPLLLQYGIPITIKNKFQDLPVEESATKQIQELLKKASQDTIQILSQKLINQNICIKLINIYEKNQVVLKKILHKNYFKNYSQYDDAFHGTHVNNLQSIARNGMRKPGDIVEGKKLEIVPGHIQLGITINGKQNWSKAIFTSPSIYYSADPVYSKQFITNNTDTWSPIVQLKVKKGSYTKHDHTLGGNYALKQNQPQALQYRVKNDSGQKLVIFRQENLSNVEVVGFIFIKKGFLESHQNYVETTNIILNSEDEKKYRQMHI